MHEPRASFGGSSPQSTIMIVSDDIYVMANSVLEKGVNESNAMNAVGNGVPGQVIYERVL